MIPFVKTIPSALVQRLNEIAPLIGNTPLFRISRVFQKPKVTIYAKLEWQQLGGSVKSRPAFNIIKEAILSGALRKGKTLLDASSGNTAIAYGTIGAMLGIPVTICLPENASPQRKKILKSLGVQLIYTSALESTDGAQQQAQQLYQANSDLFYYADQYANDNNWRAHLQTATEIWQQTEGQATHFVNALGTTGTFTGTGEGLRSLNSDIELVALQPNSPLHGLEGWKHLETAKVPAIYSPNLADHQIEIDTEAAFHLKERVAREEGLLISPSAAGNLLGAIHVANQIESGVVVTTFADDASKYEPGINLVYKTGVDQ